jgi:hypothetical protein
MVWAASHSDNRISTYGQYLLMNRHPEEGSI